MRGPRKDASARCALLLPYSAPRYRANIFPCPTPHTLDALPSTHLRRLCQPQRLTGKDLLLRLHHLRVPCVAAQRMQHILLLQHSATALHGSGIVRIERLGI